MNYLIHYGIPKRSGRYPWGSGERPYQGDDNKSFKLSDKQKDYIKKGATIAASVLVAYGGYKIAASPHLRSLILKGMNATVYKNDKPNFDLDIDEEAERKIYEKMGWEWTE